MLCLHLKYLVMLRPKERSFQCKHAEQRNTEQPIPYFSKSKQNDDHVTDF